MAPPDDLAREQQCGVIRGRDKGAKVGTVCGRPSPVARLNELHFLPLCQADFTISLL